MIFVSGFLNPNAVSEAFDRDVAGVKHLVSRFCQKFLKRLERLPLPLFQHCRWPANAHKCTIRVYDCPLRYNIYIFDDNVAVLQFYGASARGVDSPCFIVKKTAQGGLFDFARNNFDIITSGAYAFDENTGLASRQHPNIKSTSRLWQTIRSTVLK
jgi:hypothetical protein